MEFRDGSASNDHQELHKSVIEGAHHLSVSSLRISSKSSRSPNSPRSPRSPSSPSVPKSPRSPRVHGKGSPLKNDRHSHSLIDGRPKKGGSGGKGTWGGLLDIDDNYFIDPNDPNYDSSEVHS
uniref:Uncharacterized protein n=1 Tax=Quercus lobata TaxID=97700 RepID=A0A7N2KVL6_QUELO